MAVAAPARRVFQVVGLQERGSVHAGELRSLVRVDQNLAPRLPAPHRHQQCLQDQVGGLAVLHRPAHHAAGVDVDHYRQIGEAFLRPDVGDVGHLCLVGCRNIELAGQRVADHSGWLAAKAARTALVTDLRFDARKTGETPTQFGQQVSL